MSHFAQPFFFSAGFLNYDGVNVDSLLAESAENAKESARSLAFSAHSAERGKSQRKLEKPPCVLDSFDQIVRCPNVYVGAIRKKNGLYLKIIEDGSLDNVSYK